jgi:DNA-binding transcriptional regulator YiaG
MAMPKKPAKSEPDSPVEKLRKVISASGKTQEAFARDELGVSIRTLRGWLYGDRTITPLALKLIDCLIANPGK